MGRDDYSYELNESLSVGWGTKSSLQEYYWLIMKLTKTTRRATNLDPVPVPPSPSSLGILAVKVADRTSCP